jgi:hypothetical protein
MRRLTRITVPATLLLAVGCSIFEEPDVIEPAATSTGEAEETTGTGTTAGPGESDPGTSSASTSGSTGIEPDGGATTEASGASEGSSSSGADESSSGEPCDAGLPSIHWASDAVVVEPMMLTTALFLPGMPQMAYSATAEAGTITFAFELQCARTIRVQGLVWDFSEGLDPANPDSFYASIDGEPAPELEWAYGCETAGLGDESWSWQTLRSGSRNDCVTEPFEVELQAGPHELTLRNREGGGADGFDIAAIAAIVVTDDPSLDATTLFDPNP